MTASNNDSEYIKTTTHNFISRKALIEGPRQVELKGRSIVQDGVKIRGEAGIVRIGRYVWIDPDTELEPSPFLNPTAATANKRVPMMIGNHTRIESNCKIQAAAIGSMVHVGEGTRIGQRCIIKDCCVIEAGVVLGDDTVVPPFTRISQATPNGNKRNGIVMTELPPSMSVELQERSMDDYDSFANLQRAR